MKPIGVFDSGLGGLTVISEIKKLYPKKKFIYFGDTARIPYGTKSAQVITKYALQDCRFLLSKDVGAIIAACGTVSANSVDVLKKTFDIPLAGVVEGAALRAVETASNGNGVIAVLGTAATVRSNAYEKEIFSLDSGIKVISVACPMFVPLAENGYSDSQVARIIAHEYLQQAALCKPAAVILGCTHYPLLWNVLTEIFPQSRLISSGRSAVETLSSFFENIEDGDGEYYVSDGEELFVDGAARFLGENISAKTHRVSIEEY